MLYGEEKAGRVGWNASLCRRGAAFAWTTACGVASYAPPPYGVVVWAGGRSDDDDGGACNGNPLCLLCLLTTAARICTPLAETKAASGAAAGQDRGLWWLWCVAWCW